MLRRPRRPFYSRFDFTNKAAMTADQIKKTEEIANVMINKVWTI